MNITKISLTATVRFPNGDEAKFQEKPLSFKEAITRALMTVIEGDQVATVESRTYKMALAERAYASDFMELSIADVVILTDLLGKFFPHPAVVFAFHKECERGLVTLQLPQNSD